MAVYHHTKAESLPMDDDLKKKLDQLERIRETPARRAARTRPLNPETSMPSCASCPGEIPRVKIRTITT
jgi:hypothetical protein